jgi:predicted amidohydrolase
MHPAAGQPWQGPHAAVRCPCGSAESGFFKQFALGCFLRCLAVAYPTTDQLPQCSTWKVMGLLDQQQFPGVGQGGDADHVRRIDPIVGQLAPTGVRCLIGPNGEKPSLHEGFGAVLGPRSALLPHHQYPASLATTFPLRALAPTTTAAAGTGISTWITGILPPFTAQRLSYLSGICCPMTEILRIATAHIPVTAEPAKNAAVIRDVMTTAAKKGARVVHFPEGALTGYPGTPELTKQLAGWPVDWAGVQREAQAIAALAGSLGVAVVLGANHHLGDGRRPHNSLYVISEQGILVARYDKRLCSSNETHNWYTPGRRDPLTVDIGGFRFGFLLCIEINFPELAAEYASLETDVLLFSAFAKDPIFEIIARGHAAAHNMWTSISVPSQCSTAIRTGVVGPHGYWLTQDAGGDTAAVVYTDLDRDDPALDVALNRARPWRATARAGDVYATRRVVDSRSNNTTEF